MKNSSDNIPKFLQDEMASTWQWRIDTDPELAASLGLLSSRRSTHVLDPRSLSSFQRRLDWVQHALQRIKNGITEDQIQLLSPQERLSYNLYVSQLEDYVRNTVEYKAYLCCVNRLEGPHIDLPLYAKYLPLGKDKVNQFYLEFLQAIPIQLAEVTELLKAGLLEKRTPPKISLNDVVSQIHHMVEQNCDAFSNKVMSEDDGPWKQKCLEVVKNDVTNAFATFATFIETEYIPNLRTEISACKGYPNGEEYYKDCLHFHTTTSMTASEIHQLGLDEVSRIKNEMEKVAAEAGYNGKLQEYMEYLRTSCDFAPKSPEALSSYFRDIAGRIAPAMLKLFHVKTLPRSPFQITETPAAHAATAPAAYYLAGSNDPNGEARPGTFYVNTSELPTRRLYECESLALHESIPGHHTQAAIQGENESIPDFRRFCEDRRYFEAPCRFPFYTGYIEGWGLHSETLGKELGLYQKPENKFGQLSMEALRSCRLVVDTGMHALDWSSDRALNFMLEHTAMGEHDARTEVARYITWPGQATAYKVGERVFYRLRTKAEVSLGEKFDPRDFYDIALQCGPVPLDVLETLIDEYIAKKLATESTAVAKTLEMSSFTDQMTFANWCKCCIVPGTCQVKDNEKA